MPVALISIRRFLLSLLIAFPLVTAPSGVPFAADAPESATQVSDLYPNDMGPDSVDISGYPPEIKKAYSKFKFKCAACHTIARPLNSQFLELSAEEQAKWKKEDPDLFKDKKLVQVEDKIWNRYVKRMMAKPGCPVKGEDGKTIWEFLVYDSRARKTGANAKAWRAHRRKLLDDFKKSNPEGYERLFGDE